MFDLKDLLGTLRAAADAKLSGVATTLPKLNTEAAGFLETTVAKALDVPPVVVAIATSESAPVEKAAEPYEILALQFLQARIDALL